MLFYLGGWRRERKKENTFRKLRGFLSMSQIWVAIQTFPGRFSMRDSWSITPSPAWLATGFTSQCLQNLCHFLKIKELKVIVEEGAFFLSPAQCVFCEVAAILGSPSPWTMELSGSLRGLWLFSFLPFFFLREGWNIPTVQTPPLLWLNKYLSLL